MVHIHPISDPLSGHQSTINNKIPTLSVLYIQNYGYTYTYVYIYLTQRSILNTYTCPRIQRLDLFPPENMMISIIIIYNSNCDTFHFRGMFFFVLFSCHSPVGLIIFYLFLVQNNYSVAVLHNNNCSMLSL